MTKKSCRVRIRPLTSYEDFKRLIEVHRVVFRYEDRDLTPTNELSAHSRTGGILLGAFHGKRLIGFVFSFPAIYEGQLVQHSHVLAVLREFQGCGIGKRLKLAQRDRALELGCLKITWTFEPLQAKNANLNLHGLGVLSHVYLRNLYGTESSLCLGPGIPTDRLVAEWPVRKKGAGDRKRRARPPEFSPALAALARKSGSVDPWPGPSRLGLNSELVLAEVPCDIQALRSRPGVIAAWQNALRRVLEHYFIRGYAAVDFSYGDRCFYILASHE